MPNDVKPLGHGFFFISGLLPSLAYARMNLHGRTDQIKHAKRQLDRMFGDSPVKNRVDLLLDTLLALTDEEWTELTDLWDTEITVSKAAMAMHEATQESVALN